MGFERGASSACVFWHKEKQLISSVHGDDFTTAGPKSALDWFRSELEKRYELKEGARLGPAPEDDKEGRVLNRVIRWLDGGLAYEADPRQHEQLISELGMNGSKPVTTPVVKLTMEQIRADEPLPSPPGMRGIHRSP